MNDAVSDAEQKKRAVFQHLIHHVSGNHIAYRIFYEEFETTPPAQPRIVRVEVVGSGFMGAGDALAALYGASRMVCITHKHENWKVMPPEWATAVGAARRNTPGWDPWDHTTPFKDANGEGVLRARLILHPVFPEPENSSTQSHMEETKEPEERKQEESSRWEFKLPIRPKDP
jgi:hypothetical protein